MGPEKLASDDQLYSGVAHIANQYYSTQLSFLWEEFFAALSRMSGYEETKPVELKISKRYKSDVKDTLQGFNQ